MNPFRDDSGSGSGVLPGRAVIAILLQRRLCRVIAFEVFQRLGLHSRPRPKSQDGATLLSILPLSSAAEWTEPFPSMFCPRRGVESVEVSGS